jgi:NAD(P)-dependent dehydrogenase (short-subunit alcohol dehydrogenase family)
MARLEGKVAIITGGTSGIGASSVEMFAAEGATVVFCGRREDLGNQLAASVGGKTEFVRTDMTVEAEVESLMKGVAERHGRVDILFNNAGGPAPRCSIADVDMAELNQAVNILVNSVILGMKHVTPIMKAQGSGSIINNASVAAHQAGWSSSTFYSMCKAAVLHLTRCVAMELAESGVRANSVSPGAIATGIFGKVFDLPDDKAEQSIELMKKAFANNQAIKRAGLPEDIAQAALFLASDESSFMTARDIVIDGGLLGGRQWSAQQEGSKALKAALESI